MGLFFEKVKRGLIDREMKIQSNNYSYQVRQRWSQVQQENQEHSKGLNEDQLEISETSKLLKDCVEKAKELDQDRQAKVQSIKESIEKGTYHVSSKAIAKAMVEDGFFLN